ncbi:hypothetical protein EWB00_005914 [Schistosoma japonicum]|uniref:Uncharacterized protein n=1 Tax=Schistosoma japonicum TaxID=6182 RepID=A0A4Z2D019_SCHJA|nr:hypothetical protein EWB00_005914 [Schistosoma japonicum]
MSSVIYTDEPIHEVTNFSPIPKTAATNLIFVLDSGSKSNTEYPHNISITNEEVAICGEKGTSDSLSEFGRLEKKLGTHNPTSLCSG